MTDTTYKHAPLRANSDADATRIVEDWGSLLWLGSGKIGNAKGLTLGRVVIRKGEHNPRHMHPNSEELLYLLSGTLEHTLGDETIRVEAGDTITIPRGVFHNATSVGDVDADMIVAYDSPDRQMVLE